MLIFFLFLDENICCGYSLEAPHRGASNEYPQHMFSSRNKKNIMWIPPLICSYEYLLKTYGNFTRILPLSLALSYHYFMCSLTLVVLNKLRCHTHFQFSANQITRSRLLMQTFILYDNECRSRSVSFFSSQLIWIYTVSKDGAYPSLAGLELIPKATNYSKLLEDRQTE